MKIATPRRALLLFAVVAGVIVIAIARFGGGSSPNASTSRPGGSSLTIARSTEPETSELASGKPSSSGKPAASATTTAERGDAHGDDGVAEDPPAMVQPTDKPDVAAAASAFAAAWLNTYPQVSAEQWRAGLLGHITSELAAELADADPASVPAGGKVGNPVQVKLDGSLNTAAVPVVTDGEVKPRPIGTLHLTLVNSTGDWLVSEIDWEARQ